MGFGTVLNETDHNSLINSKLLWSQFYFSESVIVQSKRLT
ncbi:Uncharacterized protein ChrSV_3446 [Chromobacterium vaccinii]|nr:Uncharacterized protein ChrSW_3446 [Chromobacterium vaccinii]QND90903.1 Uncharacterized protein ChrSV_3446 [Chromobacterium vaccinii]